MRSKVQMDSDATLKVLAKVMKQKGSPHITGRGEGSMKDWQLMMF